MKLSPPKTITYWIAVILGVLGLLAYFVPTLPLVGAYAWWLVVAGFVILALANAMEGL